MFGESQNTEWEEAVIHLRKYVEEIIEAKINMVPRDEVRMSKKRLTCTYETDIFVSIHPLEKAICVMSSGRR